jgi:hypothetical protein
VFAIIVVAFAFKEMNPEGLDDPYSAPTAAASSLYATKPCSGLQRDKASQNKFVFMLKYRLECENMTYG